MTATTRTPAGWFSLVLDEGWTALGDGLRSSDPIGFPGYAPPEPESVVCASGTLAGHPVEVIAFDFSVHGGSLGVAAGERIARAFERAIERRAGVVALLATGGARMQEGMVSLVQMAKTVAARRALGDAGLPFVSHLGNPTTGGVYASFGSLADLVLAEPGATIGFAGPRVAAAMSGTPLPQGSHTAEFALAHGLADDVVAPEMLRARLEAFFEFTLGRDEPQTHAEPPAPSAAPDDAWTEVQRARDPERPTGKAFALAIAHDLVEIRGDRAGTCDPAIFTAFARIAGRRVMLLAHDRMRLSPGSYRTARRAIALAARFALPVVTFIDTPGADPSSESEAGGIAHEIASTFDALLAHPYPVVACVTGEGGSGGALAFAAADVVIALEHAIFSVIAPEGANAILRRDDPAATARDLKLTAWDLRALGVADVLVAGDDAEHLTRAVSYALGSADPASRAERWRRAGNDALEGS